MANWGFIAREYTTFDSFLIEVCHHAAMVTRNEQSYHSYLLRMWRSNSNENGRWTFMLENPHTGERHGFTSLEDLVITLQKKMDEWDENPGPVKGGGLTK